jgi:uncharacterized iron-regulated membrane protein
VIRKTIFWIHLGCGVATGLVIAMMSVTGVILTYERQMLAWADQRVHGDIIVIGERLPIEALAHELRLRESDFEPTAFTRTNDPTAAVSFSAGRAGVRFVDPYTGETLGSGAAGTRAFFSAVTGWHRWFNATGESRGPWRAITGASNLAFLFLLVSGVYLWLPKAFGWAVLKTHFWFNPKAVSSRARDYNWHHVFGIWTALPLIVIVATATVFSYSWANDLLYHAFGEEPPRRGARGPQAPQSVPSRAALGTSAIVADADVAAYDHDQSMRPLDELFAIAETRVAKWQSITLQLPQPSDRVVRFTIDQGNGGQPQRRHTLLLDAASGAVESWAPFTSQSVARRARSWVRFLHTGEALGVVGQTVAGLVSAMSVLMVWTGLALAYRRLIAPVLRRAQRARPQGRRANGEG